MTTPVVFVTANVGSIFEEPSEMLKIWAAEFLSTISRLNPKFIALHCQEVGGKNYEKSMQFVGNFVELLMDSPELSQFPNACIYLDEEFTSAEKFTALGNFYFVHESLDDVRLYDFKSQTFSPVSGKLVFSENIDCVTTMEKSKFPLEYFPECKWSRKGFLRTRWSINGTVFDLVNIHLFHDASNFMAIKAFPSEYCETRRQALMYTLQRFQKDDHEPVPLFIFGDFNFRADTQAVVERLSRGLSRSQTESSDTESTVEYVDETNHTSVFTVGKKHFSHSNHQGIFGKKAEWLREFDRELDAFRDQLFEFGISFRPSYPFEEGQKNGGLYMKTRCPAWCDRVLLSKTALPLVKDYPDTSHVEYGLIGSQSCMGDHKPVYLRIELVTNFAKEEIDDWRPIAPIKEQYLERGRGEPMDKIGRIKRVNSASEVASRREDWKNARCHSDVSWNPTVLQPTRKPFLRNTSRMRLISSSSSIHLCLPRLTSHHSSSDEDWFETIEDEVNDTKVSEEDQALADAMKIDKSERKKIRRRKSIMERLNVMTRLHERESSILEFFRKRRQEEEKERERSPSWESINLSPEVKEENPQPEAVQRKNKCCNLQ